ncbi:MAG TPA: nucleoside 2-deoxyribosyltransferase [Pirellulaceae bacterium]|jgi:nucleoside 2-deoxyribosyltransferase
MSKEYLATIYLAGPLFTQAEWQWNERLADKLREGFLNVILPQSTAEPMLKGEKPFDPGLLFRENIDGIERADAVVAIFDGADADSGTSWECGYAFKARKPVIGVRTDIRAGGDDPAMSINLMLSAACADFVHVPLAERGKVARVAIDVIAAVKRVLRKETL